MGSPQCWSLLTWCLKASSDEAWATLDGREIPLPDSSQVLGKNEFWCSTVLVVGTTYLCGWALCWMPSIGTKRGRHLWPPSCLPSYRALPAVNQPCAALGYPIHMTCVSPKRCNSNKNSCPAIDNKMKIETKKLLKTMKKYQHSMFGWSFIVVLSCGDREADPTRAAFRSVCLFWALLDGLMVCIRMSLAKKYVILKVSGNSMHTIHI